MGSGHRSDRLDLVQLLAGHKITIPPLYLRQARLSDCDQIAEFHLRIWRLTYGNIAPAQAIEALDFDRRQGQWRAKLSAARKLSLTLLAEDETGNILGLCDLAESEILDFPDAIEVTHLYLDSTVRGLGVGRIFLHLARDWLDECKRSDLVLAVVEQNKQALAFYQACGGQPVGEQLDKGPLWRSENVIIWWSSAN
ncbi:hypothetical protein A9Q94_06025 [Rhodobacterales bacterium 56_14_T64]|nr:hypothetical protein A9Q94_06025 [Rhodobacterales bacterium 56_14_T64]